MNETGKPGINGFDIAALVILFITCALLVYLGLTGNKYGPLALVGFLFAMAAGLCGDSIRNPDSYV